MVEFQDIQIAAALNDQFSQNYDDYLDHETMERLSELYSIIDERGYAAEYDQGEHNLKNAANALERQILEKRNKKDRSQKYEIASKRLAHGLLREAINGFNNRADRMLETAGTVLGESPFRIGMPKPTAPKKESMFNVSLDTSEAFDFIGKAINIGKMPKTYKRDLRDIIFKDSALQAAKQAVSDILVDIYINKNQLEDDDTDEDLKKASAGLRFLIESVKELSSLKWMLSEKLKQANVIKASSNLSISLSQPLIIYFGNLSIQVESIIEEVNSFVTSPNNALLSSIYSQVSQMANYNRIRGNELIKNAINRADKELVGTQWPDRSVVFENNIMFDKNVFGDISYYLDKVVMKLNQALDTPFERVKGLIDSSHQVRNPDYDSDMTYGNKNYSAAGQSKNVKVHSSRLINEKTTKDKDILEVLYSVTDNLLLVFGKEDLKNYDIERMRDAIGDAVFNRAGLEGEVSNYITREVQGSFDRAIK
jgi:hypothetical protein